MKTELTVLPVEVAEIAKNVSIEKRNEVQNVLNHVFNGVSKMREQLDSVEVIDENDKVNMKLANTIRLGVKNVRLENEKIFDAKRAEVQQQMLSYKTEDSLWLKAKQTMQILTKEIEENARWKEETKERFEAEQKELKIQQRILRVSKVAPEIARNEFESMSDETFEIFLTGIEKAYNDKIEAEKKAEAERVAKEKAEAERIRLQEIENAKLKAEAEKREKEIEAERKSNEQKLADERANAEIERAKLEAENNAKLKAEQEAKSKLEAELKAKKDAEIKAENERKDAKLKALKEAEKLKKSSVKNQMVNWINAFELPSTNVDNETSREIIRKFDSYKKWALAEIENL